MNTSFKFLILHVMDNSDKTAVFGYVAIIIVLTNVLTEVS